jgi:hypothetical protein
MHLFSMDDAQSTIIVKAQCVSHAKVCQKTRTKGPNVQKSKRSWKRKACFFELLSFLQMLRTNLLPSLHHQKLSLSSVRYPAVNGW